MSKQVVIYSHGFGVRKDDRGLFLDIAAALPQYQHIMFDYNNYDELTNTLTVSPLDKQAARLTEFMEVNMSRFAGAKFYLICHSQGCIVASLVKQPAGVLKTIFIAPPSSLLGAEAKLRQMSKRPGTTIANGVVSYLRRDGSTTLVGADYLTSRDGILPIELYNKLVKVTDLTIINALKDEILGVTDFSRLSPNIKVINVSANHDFTGEARDELTKLTTILL